MQRHQHKAAQIMKNQANMTPPKETNKAPVTDPKETEIYKLPDKEFKIHVLKKLSKVQQNIDEKPNKIRKTIHETK